MTEFKSKTYTNDQIQAIIALYKQSGKGITLFCKERGHKPAYQTLKGWLDAAGEGVETKAPAAIGAKTAPTDFKAKKLAFEQHKTAYLESLTDEVTRIKRAMRALQDDLVLAETELADFIKQNPVRESDVTSLAELQKNSQ